jgi:DNA-binding NarL/FixJ family response regulator
MLSIVADTKNKEIAHHFTLEEVTIKLALPRIYKKLGAKNRAAVVHLAIKGGRFV